MKIETSSRLHLSLIDLNGSEGRVDGGIGITLKNPSLIMTCDETSSETKISYDDKLNFNTHVNDCNNKILDACTRMNEYLSVNKSYTFNIEQIYSVHQGLGLGTQLALSTARLIANLNDIELSTYELAEIVQRGGTSGIGVHSFDKGGLIIDGGHKRSVKKDFLPSSASKVSPPPLLARYDFPEEWNIILATPNTIQGASGDKEVNIFQEYTPIDMRDVEKISYLTLMKLMPAVIEKDIVSFGEAVNQIQQLGFKKIERNLQSNQINEIIGYMADNGIPAVGMSSFGPTCFGITDTNVKNMKKDLLDLMGDKSTVWITKGKNQGSIIRK
ncbi:beta-ribofuranosylaminobenzene 5'-phosphate synthase [Methanosphaera sp.]